jgi:hypothetical protein
LECGGSAAAFDPPSALQKYRRSPEIYPRDKTGVSVLLSAAKDLLQGP